MTFGIDISTHQRTLDLKAAKTAGAEFVIVKSVASYTKALTIADDYESGIERVIAAGLGHAKGHYAVPNSQNSPATTAAFQWAVRHLPAATDVYMLDNEPLDGYGVFWRDDQAAAYFEELHRLGIRYSQMWLYCPAYLTRSNGPWPKIEALRRLGLKIVWVSYGDNDPYREDGEEPLLGGGITGWDVHQFTSTWRVPGYGGNVDGNYSPRTIPGLFGGEVATEASIRTWIAGYPRDWNQRCQALMWQLAARFGVVRSTPASAILAYHVERQAGRIHTDSTPPPGSFVYFDIGADGHVGFVMNGGRVLMATSHLAEELVASDAGWQTINGYVAATGADYIGWSHQNGGNTVPFSTSGTAGVGDVVVLPPETEIPQGSENNMLMIHRRGAGSGGQYLFAVFGPKFWLEFVGDDVANKFIRQISPVASSVEVTEAFWNHCKKSALG